MQERYTEIVEDQTFAAGQLLDENWDDLNIADDEQVLGFRITGQITYTLAGAPAALNTPTEAQYDAILAAIGTLTVTMGSFGDFINCRLDNLRRLCKTAHGRDIQFQPGPYPSGVSLTSDFSLFVPFEVPVGRDSLPQGMGGRGVRRHCPSAAQFRLGTSRITFQGGASFANLDWDTDNNGTIAVGIKIGVITVKDQAEGLRVIPLHYQDRQTNTGSTSYEPGAYYAGHLATLVPATVGTAPISVKLDGAQIHDPTHIDAEEFAFQVEACHRSVAGNARTFRSTPNNSDHVPILWPDSAGHAPQYCQNRLTISDAGPAWALGTSAFSRCYAPVSYKGPSEPLIAADSLPSAPQVTRESVANQVTTKPLGLR